MGRTESFLPGTVKGVSLGCVAFTAVPELSSAAVPAAAAGLVT